MISHALKAIRWYFMWRIRASTSVESDSGVDEDALNDIRAKKNDVIDELSQILKERPSDEVKVQVHPSQTMLT
jgi:hypothetical protein